MLQYLISCPTKYSTCMFVCEKGGQKNLHTNDVPDMIIKPTSLNKRLLLVNNVWNLILLCASKSVVIIEKS